MLCYRWKRLYFFNRYANILFCVRVFLFFFFLCEGCQYSLAFKIERSRFHRIGLLIDDILKTSHFTFISITFTFTIFRNVYISIQFSIVPKVLGYWYILIEITNKVSKCARIETFEMSLVESILADENYINIDDYDYDYDATFVFIDRMAIDMNFYFLCAFFPKNIENYAHRSISSFIKYRSDCDRLLLMINVEFSNETKQKQIRYLLKLSCFIIDGLLFELCLLHSRNFFFFLIWQCFWSHSMCHWWAYA